MQQQYVEQAMNEKESQNKFLEEIPEVQRPWSYNIQAIG